MENNFSYDELQAEYDLAEGQESFMFKGKHGLLRKYAYYLLQYMEMKINEGGGSKSDKIFSFSIKEPTK